MQRSGVNIQAVAIKAAILHFYIKYSSSSSTFCSVRLILSSKNIVSNQSAGYAWSCFELDHNHYFVLRSNLDRMLDSKIKEEESAHALILPPVEDYPFSEEDSEKNIVLEESQTAGEPPLIQVTMQADIDWTLTLTGLCHSAALENYALKHNS